MLRPTTRWLRSVALLLSFACAGAVGQTLPPEGSAATGIIDGVPFHIPREYLFFGVNYSGQNWLDPISTPPQPGANQAIDFFDMLLSRDLVPFGDATMRERWVQGKQILSDGATREVVVMVEKWTQAGSDARAHADAIRKLVANRIRQGEQSSRFRRSWQSEAGLIRWSERDLGTRRTRQKDVYHDREYTVFIECGYAAPDSPNAFESCRQVMFVDDLPVQITARFNQDFLPEWKRLRLRVETLIKSFVAK